MEKINAPCANACILDDLIRKYPQLQKNKFMQGLSDGLKKECLNNFSPKREQKQFLRKLKEKSSINGKKGKKENDYNQFNLLCLVLESLNFGESTRTPFTFTDLFRYMQMQYPSVEICTACRNAIADLLKNEFKGLGCYTPTLK